MLTLLKAIQSLVKTLHSEGTPVQIGAGMALGAALGLTPLLSAHNAVVVIALALLNVSFGAGMLAMAVCAPLGFLLDPLFDSVGRWLLIDTPSLQSLWTRVDGTPVLALTSFTNTVVLGSLLGWLVLAVPIFLAARTGVVWYRANLAARLHSTRVYQALVASRLYNVYRWFQP